MARLEWASGSYREGLDHGVIFLPDGTAEAWNGLTKVSQNPVDRRQIVTYRDGIKVANARSEDSFSATIEAYTYPDAVARSIFGLSYRVQTDSGYRLHLVYNARAKSSGHNYQMDEVNPFSFDISTTPVPIPGAAPSAHLVITEQAYSWAVEALENVLYGTDAFAPRLPTPQEVFDIFEENSILRVTDNGDGTFTVDGPDDVIQMIDDTTFQITWPSAIFVDDESYTISSL